MGVQQILTSGCAVVLLLSLFCISGETLYSRAERPFFNYEDDPLTLSQDSYGFQKRAPVYPSLWYEFITKQQIPHPKRAYSASQEEKKAKPCFFSLVSCYRRKRNALQEVVEAVAPSETRTG